jgi:serine/threonine protein kinase
MNDRPLTQVESAHQIVGIVNELDKLTAQTVAHRRKFQLAMSQVTLFIEHFSSIATLDLLTPEQIQAHHIVLNVGRDFRNLLKEHLLHCWAHSVLENSCSTIPSDLCAIATRLNEATRCLDEEAASYFDTSDPQWLQFHILDCKAISASLQKHLEQHPDDPHPIIVDKLRSIGDFIANAATDAPVSASRVFSLIPVNYQTWRLGHSDIDCQAEVGSGVSAVVYRGVDKRTRGQVAVKELRYKKLRGNKLRAFQREVTVLATAVHPTLLRFVGATDCAPFWVVTEWMGGGSLYHELKKRRRLNATQLTICAIDIARGMRFLHAHQIIHRDLKSLNVLLDDFGFARICDFGFSRKAAKNDIMTLNIGTPHWMAPELLAGQSNYTEKVDVYSYAIVLWEMLVKHSPYVGLDAGQVAVQVLQENLRPVFPAGISDAVTGLIDACWSRDPTKRPSFASILKFLRTGNFLFPGADLDLVLQHIKDTVDDDESALNALESELESSASAFLPQFYSTLIKAGIPSDLAERCWENLQRLGATDADQNYLLCVSLFLKTSLALKAAQVLRAQPPGKVPREIALQIASSLPTGNEALNNEFLMVACKNGAAVEAALHSLRKDHIKLALEAVACTGSCERHDEVTDQCLTCLECADTMCIVAAIRCLVAIDEAKKIPLDILKSCVQSRTMTLSLVAHIAAAKMVQEGIELPKELLDLFVANLGEVPLAGTVVLYSCTRLESAQHVAQRIEAGTAVPSGDLLLRILARIAEHVQLRPSVLRIVEKGQLEEMQRMGCTCAKAFAILNMLLTRPD